MGNSIFFRSFSQKILKKIQHLAFTEKVKIIKSLVPEKVKIYINSHFLKNKIFSKEMHYKN